MTDPDSVTPNQVVAHNLRRARGLHGWTQGTAAERLEPYLGVRWSKASFSAAERSADHGQRVKVFSADELIAFAAAFELPLAFFFTAPAGTSRVAVQGASEGLETAKLAELAGPPPAERIEALRAEFEQRLEEIGIRVTHEDPGGPLRGFLPKGGNS
jgi:transcriptional regulator with XRE-family HTH domain